MPRRLTKLSVRQIALVEFGANPGATIEIAKRAAPLRKVLGAPIAPDAPSAGELTAGGQLRPIAAKSAPTTTTAIKSLRDARQALRREMNDGFLSDDEVTPMSATEVIRKSLDAGRPLSADAVQSAVEEVAGIEYARGLSREAAIAKAWTERPWPFRGVSAENATYTALHRQARESANPITKAATESETEALAGIERLAAELRQANPKLSAAAAMSKALISERGSQYYRLYSKAQRIREEAAQ